MYFPLTGIPIWPSRQQVHEGMSEKFWKTYPSAQCVIDCTENKVPFIQVKAFWNHEHVSKQILHGLRKLILSTIKIAEGAKQDVHWRKETVFNLIWLSLIKGNQTWSELFSKIF